jgi:2-oxoglutarate dehydrogenase E1 component
MEPDFINLENLSFLDDLYARYRVDPSSVEASFRHFFTGFDFQKEAGVREAASLFQLIDAYRRYGHLKVSINPLGVGGEKKTIPELALDPLGLSLNDPKTLAVVTDLEGVYSSRIGFEYMHIENQELLTWIQREIEPHLTIQSSQEEKRLILEGLTRSETFETFLQTKYVGHKRFSLEGVETAIPVLSAILEEGLLLGMNEFFLGMSHRGRLNVLCNLLSKPYSLIFREFDDTLRVEEGGGDVKYHKGFSSELLGSQKQPFSLHLSPNPSHLESVDPVVMGQVRARQVEKGDEHSTGAILIHGDAAIAGQGVVYESMQLYRLRGYGIGGTLHLVLNNQMGFTTDPDEEYSTRYCTDIAKTFNAPVFHVNGEDPDACIFAAKMAMRIRQKFRCDVFIDLNGYRKYGHNEGDEPSFTQPVEYQIIKSKKTIREIYRDQLLSQGDIDQVTVEKLEETSKATLEEMLAQAKVGKGDPLASLPVGSLLDKVVTKVDAGKLDLVLEKFSAVPSDFHLHPKLVKWLEERRGMMALNPAESSIDWGLGECLAFGSLLLEGRSIRLSGQDSQRGTFSHRHMVWVDQDNGRHYVPLGQLKGRFDILNSPLSEYAVMGFEYGYSWASEKSLVIWEAQFGDFYNGAQIIVDQYITSAEQKWHRTSSLVLLLPHAWEGQGAEHSSARIERFLQQCALENMQIVNPTTPAQFFHLLRRQALRPLKKPLIVFTPKSLLRAPECRSPKNDFVTGEFQEILDDATEASRLFLCSGHVYYDLLREKNKRKSQDIAIVRIEELYPLNLEKLRKILSRPYSVYVWVQEEPQNMGAWEYIQPILRELLPEKQKLRYAGRKESASPATGSHRKHEEELKALLDEAFR